MSLKIWSGTAWTTAQAVKVWNGSSWISASGGKVWNGSSWIDFLGETQTVYATNGDNYTYYDDPNSAWSRRRLGDYDYFYNHGATGAAISPGTSSIVTNGTWTDMTWTLSAGVFYNENGKVTFGIKRPLASGAIPNSGWTTVTITSPVAGVTTYNRTSLIFTTNSDASFYYAYWTTDNSVTSWPDPFLDGTYGASPATVTVKFQ